MINDLDSVGVCDINVTGVLYPSARTTAGIRACKGRFKMLKTCCASERIALWFLVAMPGKTACELWELGFATHLCVSGDKACR